MAVVKRAHSDADAAMDAADPEAGGGGVWSTAPPGQKALPSLPPPACGLAGCQAALAVVQAAICVGAVLLKSALGGLPHANPGSPPPPPDAAAFHPVVFAFYREAAAGALLCTAAAVLSPATPRRRDLPLLAAMGLLLFANQLMYIVGIDLAGVSVAACMQPAIPVFTAALAIATGAEAPSRRKLAGVGLAVGGALCMVVGGHVGAAGGPGGLFAGIGLGHAALLANTFSMAVYYLLSQRLVRAYPPLCVAGWAYVPAAAAMGGVALATVPPSGWALPAGLGGPLAYWVLVCSVAGYTVVTWASQHLPASQVASFVCLQPFVGTALAALFLGERPTVWDGGALGVLAGLALVAREGKDGKVGSPAKARRPAGGPLAAWRAVSGKRVPL